MCVSAIDLYAAAFLERCDVFRNPGQLRVDELGIRGLLAGTGNPHIRVLVTDDRAHDVLAASLPDARFGMISIFGPAARCVQYVAGQLEWSSDVVTAMVCRNLHTLPAMSLPGELSLRPVRRLGSDGRDGVPLEDAVVAAMSAAPAIEGPPEVFAEYLRSLPSAYHLFAAVDSGGTVRATSGFGVFGEYATVIFVNTDPDWRGRGIGRAMTAQALRTAEGSGARHACLEASVAGRAIYRRLGFETAGTLTRFYRQG